MTKIFVRNFICIFLLSMSLGCVPGAHPARQALRVTSGQTLASLYFSTTGIFTEKVSFDLGEVALLVGDLWIDLPAPPVAIGRQQAQGKQLLLGFGPFPTGECRRVRFKLSRIRVDENPQAEFADQLIELPFQQPVSFAGNDSTCLFVDWHLTAQMLENSRFAPTFSARGQEIPLGGDLIYVLCDNIDTLYLVRTDQNMVAASFGLPGPLGEIALDGRNQKLYVVSTGARLLHQFNSVNARSFDRIALPIAVNPRHLALSADGDFAFVTDSATNQVLKIDLFRGVIARQATVGLRPERIHFFDDGSPRLAISSPTAQRVYVLSADNLDIQREIPAGVEPDSLLYGDGRLYVAERGNQSVAVFDYRSGRQLARVAVGYEPVGMIEVDGRIYVGNAGDSYLSAFYAGQNTSALRIATGEGPVALAVSERRRMLYIAEREAKALAVMDLSSERVKAVVPLGGRPTFLAVLD